MRTIYILWFLLLFAACNANLSTTEEKSSLASSDTVVAEIVVPPISTPSRYIEKEYFVVVGDDTSKYSLFVDKNIENGKTTILYTYDPYLKTNTRDYTDTSMVDDRELPELQKGEKSYEDQLREWQLIINEVSKENNLSGLKRIRTTASMFKGMVSYIQNAYDTDHQKGSGIHKKLTLEEVLFNSNVKKDLDKILSTYGLVISEVSTEKLVYAGSDSGDGMDGTILFTVSKISELNE